VPKFRIDLWPLNGVMSHRCPGRQISGVWMGMGFAPTWLRQVSPLLHKTTLATVPTPFCSRVKVRHGSRDRQTDRRDNSHHCIIPPPYSITRDWLRWDHGPGSSTVHTVLTASPPVNGEFWPPTAAESKLLLNGTWVESY